MTKIASELLGLVTSARFSTDLLLFVAVAVVAVVDAGLLFVAVAVVVVVAFNADLLFDR